MKRNVLRLSLFILLSSTASQSMAQVDIEPSTLWYHDVCCAFIYFTEGHIISEYTQDTIINGLPHMMIERQRQVWTSVDNISWSGGDIQAITPIFLYQNGDSLFYNSQDTLILFADFSAVAGDLFSLHSPDSIATGRIDAVTDTLLSGVSRRVLHTSVYSINCSDWYESGLIIEGIGRTSGPFFFNDQDFSACLFDDTHINFCGVIVPDGSLPTDTPACVNSPVGLNEIDRLEFLIGPNPSDGVVQISTTTPRQLSITVYDSSGKEVIYLESMVQENYSIDLSDHSIGTYLIHVTDSNSGQSAIKKVAIMH